jgi:hypothetical protein
LHLRIIVRYLHYDGSLRVPLSSIDQHSVAIGERTGAILMRMIESKVPSPMNVILDPLLVVRASSMRVAKDASTSLPAKPGTNASQP